MAESEPEAPRPEAPPPNDTPGEPPPPSDGNQAAENGEPPPPGKKKKKKKKKKTEEPQKAPSILWLRKVLPPMPEFLPCLHKCFKTKTIDRNKIGRQKHIDILSTPKQEPWKQEEDQTLYKYRRKPCSERTKFLAIPRRMHVLAIVRDFRNVLNEEQIARLNEMLKEDYQMTREKIREFVTRFDKEEKKRAKRKRAKRRRSKKGKHGKKRRKGKKKGKKRKGKKGKKR